MYQNGPLRVAVQFCVFICQYKPRNSTELKIIKTIKNKKNNTVPVDIKVPRFVCDKTCLLDLDQNFGKGVN